jgi:protein gp37
MSKETKIQWADSTVNFWSGCTKVSDGCKNCYAETLSNRKLGSIGGWGKGASRKWHESAVKLALSLNRKPLICDFCGAAHAKDVDFCECGAMPTEMHRRRVFSLSLGDWLDPEVPIDWLAGMLRVIHECQDMDWLLVTKRPELFHQRMHDVWAGRAIDDPAKGVALAWSNGSPAGTKADGSPMFDVPKHVMVLASVENQKAADERIPALLNIPARWRGLSCEPLLESVELGLDYEWGAHQDGNNSPLRKTRREGIHWVIVGGESGTKARACSMDWIQDIVRQGKAADVPVFVKQLGKLAVCDNANVFDFPDGDMLVDYGEAAASCRLMTKDGHGGDWEEWPRQLRVREFYQAEKRN